MFDDYLNGLSDEESAALTAVVEHVAAIAPEATEGRSYGLPAFRYRDKPLLAFAAHRQHLGLYPFSPAVIDAARQGLDGFEVAKGSIRFTPSRPVPNEPVTELVRARMAEIDGD
jgi:uncharacterized protein YdhG (YjbR/CyaY superfamily)